MHYKILDEENEIIPEKKGLELTEASVHINYIDPIVLDSKQDVTYSGIFREILHHAMISTAGFDLLSMLMLFCRVSILLQYIVRKHGNYDVLKFFSALAVIFVLFSVHLMLVIQAMKKRKDVWVYVFINALFAMMLLSVSMILNMELLKYILYGIQTMPPRNKWRPQ